MTYASISSKILVFLSISSNLSKSFIWFPRLKPSYQMTFFVQSLKYVTKIVYRIFYCNFLSVIIWRIDWIERYWLQRQRNTYISVFLWMFLRIKLFKSVFRISSVIGWERIWRAFYTWAYGGRLESLSKKDVRIYIKAWELYVRTEIEGTEKTTSPKIELFVFYWDLLAFFVFERLLTAVSFYTLNAADIEAIDRSV